MLAIVQSVYLFYSNIIFKRDMLAIVQSVYLFYSIIIFTRGMIANVHLKSIYFICAWH